MVRRVTKDNVNAQSTALPSGGPTENGARDPAKTVDRPTSSFDRRRHHIVRKEQEPSKIFVPLDPNDVPKNPNRGKNLHTDPFAMDRVQVEAKRHRVKVQTPRGPQRPERKHTKTVVDPIKPAKAGFITANGVRHLSPKRVPRDRTRTTMQKDQPPKRFDGSRRFAQSPERKRAEAAEAAKKASIANPAALTRVLATTAISNVFPTDAPAVTAPPPERARGIRQTAEKHKYVTMEGVFNPMRSGKPPKPSSLAPWMQETAMPHTGKARGSLTARPAQVPFAIEA